ncbi:SulP family inorganic anion transporter [Pseudenhygromyxa sp. WMMC2535]|uniref:SulP family inorganic anion transporter n=1 Tax=Pseudenhygromyxa sp. WMMC2535 TaxID=2712867 RepID=UPI0015541432|nr:SulP family inorganic anion transporter [Pseudenhygromyxa sp. WMMC2535]NVB36766.1 SulP family inorganic anion transporter [Pseudenhygromyxa sp. WMMC2535]
MSDPKPSLGERARALVPDLSAAGATLFLGVPQGLAYATIAGLPPAMGLFASTLPTIIGSLFRSSRHVVVGPTNALSLLVGGAVIAAADHDPLQVGVALALGAAVFQILATVLRLGAVIDYISSPTVLGYITGAGVLIGLGQLHNLTATSGPKGKLWVAIPGWLEALPAASMSSVIFAAGTLVAAISLRLLARKLERKLPEALLVMLAGIVVNLVFDLESRGLRVIADLSPIPPGLPPPSLPSLELTLALAPAAAACAVLSLVESNAVARSIAARTGQRLDTSREFLGQALANLSAAFFSGYPVSGSLSRSALNAQAGARSRASGMITGALMIVVLALAASILDHTPIASLAGLLLVVAWDLVDLPRIRRTLKTSRDDALAFFVTLVATWTLDLDKAIYLGVGVSLVLFLRKARLLTIRELVVNAEGLLQEHALGAPLGPLRRCAAIRLLHVEGALFFGSAGELRRALEGVASEQGVRVIIVRIKRTSGLDMTAAEALAALAESMQGRGQHLLLVGMTPDMMPVLERSGAAAAIGEDGLFPTRGRWFAALEAARQRAFELVGEHGEDCGLDHAQPFLLTGEGVRESE